MLQIRIAEFDGTNPIILERATNRKYSKVISSADEGISFEIAKNDPKAEILNPYIDGYTRRWEVWNTDTNKRLNFGPITNIDDRPSTWAVTGGGRSALLADFYDSHKSFYSPIFELVRTNTFENIAAQPRASTHIVDTTESAEQTTVFGDTVVINEKYHGLSRSTKDNVIDNDSGNILPGKVEPPNTFYSNDTYWSGMSKADSHIVDLGAIYNIKRIKYSLPVWGGPRRAHNRAYDFEIAVATDESPTTSLQGKEFGTFTTIYTTDVPNRVLGLITLYIGDDGAGGITVVPDLQPNIPITLDLPPVPIRYIRMKITNVRAWVGTPFDDDPAIDVWDYECDPDYVQGSIPSIAGPAQMKGPINDRVLEPPNDCHASINEATAEQEIINVNYIKPLALQRVDNNSLQILYSHTPGAGETITTDNGYRKFEPGSFFRRVQMSWSGATNSYTKFFDDDCTGCFPDGFRFGVMDQGNSLVYATDSTSGTNVARTFGAQTSHLMFKGASNATVTWCDAWPAITDPLSYGGSYSYTEIADDYAVIHFRGESFKWYATIPADKTGAQVTLSIREKSGSAWSSYSNLITFTLPNDISSEVVYEIPYESGFLQPDTVYEIKINNDDGNYCSIDSIGGYWSSSMVEYNEDSSRIFVSHPERVKQIYDSRFSNGSMYKMMDRSWASINFTGDRVIVTSAKGRNHGKASIILINKDLAQGLYDPGTSNHVFIPGGDPSDGSLTVDLDTGKRGNEIPQFVLFDSNDYFTDGLPWGRYAIGIYLLKGNLETYTSNTADIDFDSFVSRCKDCEAPTGNSVTVNKPIFIDGVFAHEVVGISATFENETQLDILKSVAEATQNEWSIDADGLIFEPRIGTDTNVMLREGESTLVDWGIVNDISQMASILISSGADIDGLPLFTITENKETRSRLKRTVMRQHDFRNINSYFQLVGLSRTELLRRAYPDKRIQVKHIGSKLGLEVGDSFILWTKKGNKLRTRILRKEIDESSGRVYNLECVTWPQIV